MIIPSDFKNLEGLDRSAAESGLTKLRELKLAGDDIEIRVGIGSRFGGDRLVLTRTAGVWRARHFPRLLCPSEEGANGHEIILEAPTSGWDVAWQKLKAAGLLSISGRHDAGWNDGYEYLVETNINNTYVLSDYVNPDKLKNDEGKQMVSVGDTIADEFGLRQFKRDFTCSDSLTKH